ncbi:hypothetical protein RF11_12440 [Thelohanellus kitauei]|uniref:Uncharacterized protein n=1 Tax=Thelohanellus kitauei TaxID=669202 RepID=A0A0C2MWR5_THEKT|nr:hypothetical protein RF11_12440 [Thelohanellus kitauei]
MKIYQAEISPNISTIDKAKVQYKLKLVESCYGINYSSFNFLRLNDGLGYQTLLFVTFSMDAGGKLALDAYHLNFKIFKFTHDASGFEKIVSMSIGVAKGLDDLEDLGMSLITTVDRIDKLREGQKYLKGSQIYFVPNRDQRYQDIPRYAEIQIYLLDKSGRVISNPEVIKDIVEIKVVDSIADSQVPLYTTEYMKKYDLIIVITEPDTQKQWRAIYTFSDYKFIPKERSPSNSEFFGIVPSFMDAKTVDKIPEGSIQLLETFTRVFQCKIRGKNAFTIEKSWNGIMVKQQSVCEVESHKSHLGYLGMFMQVPCSSTEIESCKSQVEKDAQK